MTGDPTRVLKLSGQETPAVIHVQIVPGDRLEIDVAAKGGGSVDVYIPCRLAERKALNDPPDIGVGCRLVAPECDAEDRAGRIAANARQGFESCALRRQLTSMTLDDEARGLVQVDRPAVVSEARP